MTFKDFLELVGVPPKWIAGVARRYCKDQLAHTFLTSPDLYHRIDGRVDLFELSYYAENTEQLIFLRELHLLYNNIYASMSI